MLRTLSFLVVTAVGLGFGQGQLAKAEHCESGYRSGHRSPGVVYGVPNRRTYQSQYGGYSGRPLYSGGYPANWSYYGAPYGFGLNVPFGGYGTSGFPRYGSYGMGGGFPPSGSYGMGGGFPRSGSYGMGGGFGPRSSSSTGR